MARGQNFQQIPLKIVGSSTFGRYPKISIEKTINMFESDNFLVPYSGYQIGILASKFNNGIEGRAIFTSTKLDRLVVVIDQYVYLVNLQFNQISLNTEFISINLIGELLTTTGFVYIAENNKPQILISDNQYLYVYDQNYQTLTPAPSSAFFIPSISFQPGYITFHDTYFICAATNDQFEGASNTWRLSNFNDGSQWPNDSSHIGLLQTKPDITQAVLRFPSKGNMIFVMGKNVTEAWFDTGAQLFPYQRNNQMNIDYGCLSPATVAYMDERVVWLAANEKSGPVIMHSNGGIPEKITTDGIDYFFSQLQTPEDSEAFIYRQDGHLFYHINFYTDNLSLFYDFNTNKFYHACDQNLNYFIAAEVAFFNNQYYFVSRNNGNLYALDTSYTRYQDTINGIVENNEIPRIRTCQNIRLPTQDYFIANDVGFTIESGETPFQQEPTGNVRLITQDDEDFLITQDSRELIINQTGYVYLTPRVDMSISIDGGATFGSDQHYWLPPLGYRKNRLMWWQQGLCNDLVFQFKFWGMGRFVCTDGICNIRQ